MKNTVSSLFSSILQGALWKGDDKELFISLDLIPEVDAWLTDDLYLHPNFKEFFDKRAGACTDGLWPTVTIRQIMWALKMKPLPKERWETVFDRRDI